MQRVLVLSTADFDSAVWTNKQHLAQRLAHDFDVIYYGSIGLRRPVFAANDLRRIAKTLLSLANVCIRVLFLKPSAADHSDVEEPGLPSPRVIRPFLVPFHGNVLVDLLNSLIAWAQLRRYLGRSTVLWTFSPIELGLGAKCGATVYHSVDLLHTLDGTPSKALLKAEKSTAASASVVIASSRGVERHLTEDLATADVNPPLLWENVAAVDVFGRERGVKREPRAIFAGNLTSSKVDFGLLGKLAESGISLVLAGPTGVDGTDDRAELDHLLLRGEVTYLGNLSLEDLAIEMAKSQVGLVPYFVNPYTTGVFPMKVYEYMAAGLAVVTTPLPSLKCVEGLRSESGTDAFILAVSEELLRYSAQKTVMSRQLAADRSWVSRAEDARDLIARIAR